MTPDDMELVRQYAAHQSESAFAALVSRHTNLVYSASLRLVRDPQLAEEVTQAVFIILAQKAATFNNQTIVPGWLYRTACFVAGSALKREHRRQQREQEAYMQSTLDEPATDAAWQQMAPLLEDAMLRLRPADRDALVLRFFEGRSLNEVGASLGIPEETAKKRVSRALEKLHRYFSRRGISSTTAIIAGTLSANSVHAAPAALAKTVTVVALAKGTVASASTLTLIKGALKLMAWTNTKTAVVTGVGLLLAVGTTTLTVKTVSAHYAYRDSWRVVNLNSAIVDQTPPQVRILPTKFHNRENNLAENNSGTKWGGINMPVSVIAWVAYQWNPARVVFATPPPPDKYDFITTRPQGAYGALQLELKNTLGYVGRPETREVDVLRLRVRNPGASGLKPSVTGSENDWSGPGHYVGEDRALSSDGPPYLGLTRFLEQAFETPVIDQTGLTQHFNIDLKWTPQSTRPAALKAVQQALLDQLGLELVPGRESIEVLVVEKVK